jgi:hypothetical protein
MTEEKKLNHRASLLAEERETIISWADDDEINKIFIHTTMMPIMRRLLKNPQFEVQRYLQDEGCEPHGIEGYLPRNAITIRTKQIKHNLSPEEREQRGKRLLESIRNSKINKAVVK